MFYCVFRFLHFRLIDHYLKSLNSTVPVWNRSSNYILLLRNYHSKIGADQVMYTNEDAE